MFPVNIFLFLFSLVLVQGTIKIDIIKNNMNIPPADDAVCMARYIVHNSDWCSLAYISENNASTLGSPLSRIYSISDGTVENSTGIVYFMVSPLDLTIQDLFKNQNCSIIMSLAQSHYCRMKQYDAQDPRCAQVILNGHFTFLGNNTEEINKAKAALWTRHPVMKFWYYNVPTHKWIFAKIEIHQIAVVDMFGGRKFPAVDQYFTKKCTKHLTKLGEDFRIVEIQNI